MRNQIEIVKDIADGMYGIGGIPNNEEFYAEFDMRVKAALGIAPVISQVCPNCTLLVSDNIIDGKCVICCEEV